MLKKLFPMSYKFNDSVASLVIGVIIYVVTGIVGGLLVALAGYMTGWIPVVGFIIALILRAAGAVVDIYITAGIVISFLTFFKVIKD